MKKQNVVTITHKKDSQSIYDAKIRENIRQRRAVECFPYINRGRLWYNKLTDAQLVELSRWYEEWLDAPKTLKIPKKLSWLDNKLEEEFL